MIGGTTIGIGVGIRRPSLPGGFLKRRPSVPGFVGGWKTYSKNNADSDRDILKDYSGNGRDIKLYNFAFAGMSGYGGYGSSKWDAYGDNAELVDGNIVKITNTSYSGVEAVSLLKGDTIKIRYKVSGYKSGCELSLYTNTRNAAGNIIPSMIREITEDGIYEDTLTWDSVNAGNDDVISRVFLVTRINTTIEDLNITIEQLPFYPGGLISDGVDDCGECIKSFALPNDYTVVALRKIMQGNGGVASKGTDLGAFSFDAQGNDISCWSYGGYTSVPLSKSPELFSYQMKNSYNGTTINVGTMEDTESAPLCLFKLRKNTLIYSLAVLYDLRIYDHSLTAEELQTVKDEMMTDFEASAMRDVTYVADWDAKGRSNDEEEPARSKWIDKVNSRILNLNNFAFAAESGWNGYRLDWSKWKTNSVSQFTRVLTGNKVTFSNIENYIDSDSHQINFYKTGYPVTSEIQMRVRVSGMKEGEYCGWSYKNTEDQVGYIGIPNSILRQNGEIVFTAPPCAILLGTINNITDGKDREITIEQLPLYPGALAFDGVDDTGTADAALGKVGTVLMHWKNEGLPPKSYVYNTGGDDSGRLYMWNTSESSTDIRAGIPSTPIEDSEPIMVFRRSGLVSEYPLILPYRNNCPIYRLIFIEEQLNDSQVAFLKWKVSKEYNDWCKANGYEYAVEEMLNN